MDSDIYFMPLGGGQRIGASCYYLKIANTNIILDAGTGKEHGMVFEPDLYSLVTSPFVQSLGQINQIYISHAHADHIGYLSKLMKETSRSDVYMTEITALLSEYQLYDRIFLSGKNDEEYKRLATQHILDKVTVVSYMQTMDFGKFKVTFLPAGHIPGAMMTLFECGKRRILYTGDYSLESTPLTDGCMLPENAAVDTLIMCGLHAKHPNYMKKSDRLFQIVREALQAVEQNHVSVKCHIPQISKGVEFLKILNLWNINNIPVYIDKSIMQIVAKIEKLTMPVMNMNNRIKGDFIPAEPHIYITAETNSQNNKYYQNIEADFSLHEDFSEMKEFIKRINPKQAFIVHCGKEHSVYDLTIEQVMMHDGDCRTQFVFAEEKNIYKL